MPLSPNATAAGSVTPIEVRKDAVEFATLEWVSWFNHHRLFEPIGCIPLAEAEANYYRQLASQAAVAVVRLKPNSLLKTWVIQYFFMKVLEFCLNSGG